MNNLKSESVTQNLKSDLTLPLYKSSGYPSGPSQKQIRNIAQLCID